MAPSWTIRPGAAVSVLPKLLGLDVLERQDVAAKAELRVVEGIERLKTQLDAFELGEPDDLAEGEIGVVDPWTMEVVSSFAFPAFLGSRLKELGLK